MQSAAPAARIDGAALALALAIGITLPFSTVLDGVLFVLVVLAWVAGRGYRAKAAAARANPFAMAAAAIFLLALAGSTYSVGSANEILRALDKAAVILLVPILVSLKPGPEIRERAMRAFLFSMAVLLLLSYAIWLGILPTGGFIRGSPGDAVVVRKHITHSFLMAFFAYALALRAREAMQPGTRVLLAAGAALAAFNVLFMVHGRTGQLVLVALFAYLLLSRLGWRGAAIAVIAGALIGVAVYLTPSSALHQRVLATIAEVQDWRAGRPAQEANLRPETWGNSLEIVRQHPIIGVGTGGFAVAYAKQVEGTAMRRSPQPENQFVLAAVQHGVIGLVALLALFAAQWHLASGLATRSDTVLARGLVLAMVVGCMFNSFLLDHTEALFYAWLSGFLYAGWRPRGVSPAG